jgi:hypothetical protein
VPRASPKHRLDCETAYSIISAKTGIVKYYLGLDTTRITTSRSRRTH